MSWNRLGVKRRPGIYDKKLAKVIVSAPEYIWSEHSYIDYVIDVAHAALLRRGVICEHPSGCYLIDGGNV
jgi:hypothetical protein